MEWRRGSGTSIARLLAAVLLALIPAGAPLNCYICAEGNLGEFGECSSPFQFDCVNYEKRYPDDKIYCRTTRHKAVNGTYAIVKECISESAHYSNFPRKNQQLNEECDVIEVDGFEVAYCLCRDADYCNKQPIVDQFTGFENKYPEFFEPDPRTDAQPPFEHEHHSGRPGTSRRGDTLNEHGIDRKSSFDGTDAESVIDPHRHGYRSGGSDFELGAEEFRNAPSGFTSSTPREPADSLDRPQLGSTSPSTGGQHLQESISSLGTPITPILTCAQCSQANLPNADADCAPQTVVNCVDQSKQLPGVGKPLCFSRQIVTPKGLYGVEKMCVPERAILEEFGKEATLDGCKTVESGGVVSKYCVCRSPQCNRASVGEQILFHSKSPYSSGRPTTPPADVDNDEEVGHTSMSTTTAATNSTVATEGHGMNCASCLDTELNSSTADCRQASVANCAAQLPKGARAYCLTRQTQNGKGSYIVEKKCIDRKGFFENFPEELRLLSSNERDAKSSEERVEPHCASTYDGYVNFCLCQVTFWYLARVYLRDPGHTVAGDWNMCSKESLPHQAEALARIATTTTSTSTTTTTTVATTTDTTWPTIDSESEQEEFTSKGGFRTTTTTPASTSPMTEGSQVAHPRSREPTNDSDGRDLISEWEKPTTRRTPRPADATATPSVRERLERWKASTSSRKSSGSTANSPYGALATMLMLLISIML